MKIDHYDHGRYFVDCGSGSSYLVDVEEFPSSQGPIGWCSCKDYYYKHLPLLEREAEMGLDPMRRRCKHLEAIFSALKGEEPP